jgi:uncharacterized membrane protein YdjX (TVP38/TMEM64 family)
MPPFHPHASDPTLPKQSGWVLLRGATVVLWSILLIAFWLGARSADSGPVDYLFTGIDRVAAWSWAPVGVFALYLVRPLLLVPITVVNLASGFVLGAVPGLALALVGTFASASIGYGIGRMLGSFERMSALTTRWPILRSLRRRSFESVAAGGLMFLHAEAVNLPAGLLRIHFPVFLAGIAVGNSLTMTSAVLAGSSVEGSLRGTTVSFDGVMLGLALALFTLSLVLASWLRRRRARADGSEALPAGGER